MEAEVGRRVQRFVVEYYEKEDGTYPAEEFILAQDAKMRAKLFRLLTMLELEGNELREPYSKSIGDGLFEIRAIQGSNITRVLYFFVIGHKIILTNGFVKKSDKTPERVKDVARRYRAAYFQREGF